MTDSTAEFFHELDRRGHEPLLEKATGSVRFDLADGRQIDRWPSIPINHDSGEVQTAGAFEAGLDTDGNPKTRAQRVGVIAWSR